MDRSPPGASVRGIFQARILEWVVISSCRVQTLKFRIEHWPQREPLVSLDAWGRLSAPDKVPHPTEAGRLCG